MPENAPRLMVDPSGRRMRGDTRQMNAPRTHFNEEEHVQGLQLKGFDREEIACQELMAVVREERAP